MSKKARKSHHDKGVRLNLDRQEHQNSYTQQRDPRLNQQEIAKINLAQNREEGNEHYKQTPLQMAETAAEFDVEQFEKEQHKKKR